MYDSLLHAAEFVFTWKVLLATVLGVFAGVIVGALPGLTATMGIAVIVPLTYGVDPLLALGIMAGVYNGAMYGGAIPAILLRIPGTPAAICTSFDGFPLAQSGRASLALQTAAWSSSIGGIIGALALILLAPPLAEMALLFGPTEFFWLAVFGLSTIAVMLGKDLIKGLTSAVLGVLLATIGIDPVSGLERLTFGVTDLLGGLDIVVLLTALYAIPPALTMAERAIKSGIDQETLRFGGNTGFVSWIPKMLVTWVRGSVIGVVVGVIPGIGGNIAAFISYNETKRAARDPEAFGSGTPVGIAASESANNSDTSATLIPALTLGVPGNVISAVILGGLLVHGLRPGPALFRDNPDIVYGFMIEMLLTAILIAIVGAGFFARIYAQVLRIPAILLMPMVFLLTVVGVYSVQNSMFDLYMMLGFGILGYCMERLDYPLAPAVLGLILGSMAEAQLRLALLLSQGDPTTLFVRPISIILIIATILILSVPVWRWYRGRGRGQSKDALQNG